LFKKHPRNFRVEPGDAYESKIDFLPTPAQQGLR
jgi:hypothetical protein